MPNRILVIDDDKRLLTSLEEFLRSNGFSVNSLADPGKALSLLKQSTYHCVLLDIHFPMFNQNGVGVLQEITSHHPEIAVIMISGEGNIKQAIECVKLGAYDFIEKPIDLNRLLITTQNAIRTFTLKQEKETVLQELRKKFPIIGNSPEIKKILQEIHEVAPTPANVLILGESGTGKELVARAIHNHSARNGHPFVSLNCSAISKDLLESELFGHRKGAFTGATENRKGVFQAADGGSLFLDDIGEMNVELQPKLLRAIEYKEVKVVGASVPQEVDVRIIAATNRNLKELVKEKKFREDLYYRLGVMIFHLPLLKERIGDIPLLVDHFLQKLSASFNKPKLQINNKALAMLMNYDWQGNVRELSSIMQRLFVFCKEKEIMPADVTRAFQSEVSSINVSEASSLSLKEAVAAYEKNYIVATLHSLNWRKEEAAKAMSIDRTSLFRKMKRLSISESQDFGGSK